MKLTEWQNVIEHRVSCHEISTSRLYTVMRDKQNELEKQLQQYKSLVKTVDADNLPDKPAIYVEFNEIKIRCLHNKLALCKLIDTPHPTHYIEQKDLIKMISGEG